MHSPFVVSQLTPQGTDGRPAGIYQLDANSVSPTRVVGRDENGMPVEETVPTVYWRHFAMPDGGWNKVPLRTGSVFSMHEDAVAYERMVTTDLVRAGAIPGWLCPYSTEFTHLTRGPFVPVPAGEEDCGGNEQAGGCKHMKALMARRKAIALEKHTAEVRRIESLKSDEINRMRDGIVEGVGTVIGKFMSAQDGLAASRAKLKAGKGEE
jgi:hypothetical protein